MQFSKVKSGRLGQKRFGQNTKRLIVIYRIIQNDNTQQSWFWHEPIQLWVEMETGYKTIGFLTKMMREGRKCDCILASIGDEIDGKYA